MWLKLISDNDILAARVGGMLTVRKLFKMLDGQDICDRILVLLISAFRNNARVLQVVPRCTIVTDESPAVCIS
jgi:hypothetical protein